MDLKVLIDCPSDWLQIVRSLAEAAGTPLAVIDEQLVLSFQFSKAKSADELHQRASVAWQALHSHVKGLCGGARLLAERQDFEVRVVNAFFVDETGARRWLPISGQLQITLDVLVADDADDEVHTLGSALRSGAAPAQVMRLLAGDWDWTNLYRIFEVIEKDIGGEREMVKRGWASAGELQKFTGSANHPGVSGDSSRHGVASGPPPQNTIGLNNAIAMIKRIARSYLRAAAPSPSS